MELSTAKQRRLLEFLMESSVRSPTQLPLSFVRDLSKAFNTKNDPARTQVETSTSNPSNAESWSLRSIRTEGFGGLNSWNGGSFQFDLDGQSVTLEGTNGSGKSSLVAAIVWGLTGERPRDQANSEAETPQPVFSGEDTPVGKWPPIATYPDSAGKIRSRPRVTVELTFQDSSGSRAAITRTLDGEEVTTSWPGEIQIPRILIEAGLLMPLRLTTLRLQDEDHLLATAVQQLTGFDDLVATSDLVEGLCHSSREYRSYKKAILARSKQEFRGAIDHAVRELEQGDLQIDRFVPADTRGERGPMVLLAENVEKRVETLEQVIADDLAFKLDTVDTNRAQEVSSAITRARLSVNNGIEELETWKALQSIAYAFDARAVDCVQQAISDAREAGKRAVELLQMNRADSKFRLKAVAAKWHESHRGVPIVNCPLCDQSLDHEQGLRDQLEDLRAAGNDAAREFSDNVNAIVSALDQAKPDGVRHIDSKYLGLDPRDKLIQDLRNGFVLKEDYANCLKRFGEIAEASLSSAPPASTGPVVARHAAVRDDSLKPVNDRIADLERLLALARWFQLNSTAWRKWWMALAGTEDLQQAEAENRVRGTGDEVVQESLSAHLVRLEDALSKARPFRKALESIRSACRSGMEADQIQRVIDHRRDITNSLAELKKLRGVCESLAREALEDLSDRIKGILGRLHLEGSPHFERVRLERRSGMTVVGKFSEEVRVDATQVANTSWIRAFLWAFLFALREEAVENLGRDQLPLLVVDDPQMTFDAHHRKMWADHVRSLQGAPQPIQLLLTTHDESFLDRIKVDGIIGRGALIIAPTAGTRNAQILEGGKVSRLWSKVRSNPTPSNAQQYMAEVRVFVEGMLKEVLRGQGARIDDLTVGTLRDRIRQEHGSDRAPWNQPPFKKLVKALDPGCSAVKYIAGAHHTTGRHYGISEACCVKKHWHKTLEPAINRASRSVREHRLLHSGLSALHGGPAVVDFPEGYQEHVRAIPLTVLGCASALTEGRIADGMVQVKQFREDSPDSVMLENHSALRLAASTLEPVARPGEILLIHNHRDPTPKSLVVAISEDTILARRFEIAENHKDVAILTAQSMNPRQIEPPVIAHRSSFDLRKIVGVLYDSEDLPPNPSGEVVECGGEFALKRLAKSSLGLLVVQGQSAVPYALDGQHLIITGPVNPCAQVLRQLDGQPVIAQDSEDCHYFKRLRKLKDNRVILESLSSDGASCPVMLSPPNDRGPYLRRVWPVVGVLFE